MNNEQKGISSAGQTSAGPTYSFLFNIPFFSIFTYVLRVGLCLVIGPGGPKPSPRPLFFGRPEARHLKKGPSSTFVKGHENLSILFSLVHLKAR